MAMGMAWYVVLTGIIDLEKDQTWNNSELTTKDEVTKNKFS